MIEIVDELRALVGKLDQHKIDYALCGGMAMGVHGFARTTIDIALLILAEALEPAMAIAKDLGYRIRSRDLSFKDGGIEIRRISKIDSETGDLLPLDFLLVTLPLQAIWNSRMEAEWEGGRLSVVSRDGLIELKQLRNSAQDIADIQVLTGSNQNG